MSNGHRWSKFWWQDWQNEKSLQGCSMAARGLWMEVLCLAHAAEPYGHLLINGKCPTNKRLSDLCGNTTEKEVAKLLAELEEAGVFSRTEDGTIYCRRMVRDGAASDEGRRNVAKRWGPNGANHPGHTPNTPPIRGATPVPIRKATSPPNTLEAKKLEERTKANALDAVPASGPSPRDQLWSEGLSLLRSLTGQSDRAARSAMGKLVRDAKDDCAKVFNALWDAGEVRPIDPMPWLIAAVKPQKAGYNPFLDPALDDEKPRIIRQLAIDHVH